MAAASHLPFLLSVALVGCTAKSVNWEDIAQLAATGYHDLTRLASGDAIMHRDICMSNPEPIVAWIDAFIRELYEIRKLLNDGGESSGEDIKQVFEEASLARAKWLAGLTTPLARQRSDSPEIPSFSETMGQMFLGQKGMEVQRRIFNDKKGEGRKK